MTNQFFQKYFQSINQGLQLASESQFHEFANRIESISSSQRKLIVVGNGGSSAIASHVSVDFTKTVGIRAINFNEADLLTCFANDYGFEKVFEKALEFYADKGDLLILISSSGSSPNIIRAAEYANKMKIQLVTFSGFKSTNPLRQLGDINFWVDSSSYNVVEMTHHIWLLAIVDYLIQKNK